VCQTLHGLVSDERQDAYRHVWALWRNILPTLNRAEIIPRDEQLRFAADCRAFVELLRSAFPWLQISPKLHMLLCHAAEFMFKFGSIGLYGEHAVEAWHGHCNQHAAQFTPETELQSCVRVLRSTALASSATDALLRLRAPIRRRTGRPNRPARTGDRRRKENKPGVRHCRATTAKGATERKAWAKALFFDALERVETYQGKE